MICKHAKKTKMIRRTGKTKRQKGISNLNPSFPETLHVAGTHPIVYSANGSHGLWASPGKTKQNFNSIINIKKKKKNIYIYIYIYPQGNIHIYRSLYLKITQKREFRGTHGRIWSSFRGKIQTIRTSIYHSKMPNFTNL